MPSKICLQKIQVFTKSDIVKDQLWWPNDTVTINCTKINLLGPTLLPRAEADRILILIVYGLFTRLHKNMEKKQTFNFIQLLFFETVNIEAIADTFRRFI